MWAARPASCRLWHARPGSHPSTLDLAARHDRAHGYHLHPMLELSRTVRFCVSPCGEAGPAARDNTFAAWPSMTGLGVFYEMTVRCRGATDERTGFMGDITVVDTAVRDHVIPRVESALTSGRPIGVAGFLRQLVEVLDEALDGTVAAVRWHLTPYYRLEMETRSMRRVTLLQQFEFAASHRLHRPALDDAENARLFGRCNNPNGHGHNYRLEVEVQSPIVESTGAAALTLPAIEAVVRQRVLDRFDHKNLNLDTVEFADVNPTVEAITQACFDLLAPPIENGGGKLVATTVWETDKTCCRCTSG